MSETLLANQEAARTETGEIKDQTPPPESTTPTTISPPEQPKVEAKPEGKPSVLNEKSDAQLRVLRNMISSSPKASNSTKLFRKKSASSSKRTRFLRKVRSS